MQENNSNQKKKSEFLNTFTPNKNINTVEKISAKDKYELNNKNNNKSNRLISAGKTKLRLMSGFSQVSKNSMISQLSHKKEPPVEMAIGENAGNFLEKLKQKKITIKGNNIDEIIG